MMVITSALDTFAVAMGTLALRLTYGLESKPTFKCPDQTSLKAIQPFGTTAKGAR